MADLVAHKHKEDERSRAACVRWAHIDRRSAVNDQYATHNERYGFTIGQPTLDNNKKKPLVQSSEQERARFIYVELTEEIN